MPPESATAAPSTAAPYAVEIRRCALAAILLPDDLAVITKRTPRTAARWIRQGKFGPWFEIGRRPAVRRESFLAWLSSLEARFRVVPGEAPAAPSGGDE